MRGLTPFFAIVRKDLLLFITDRRAVLWGFAVPIVAASFIGAMTSGMGSRSQPVRISVAIVDEDGSAISKSIAAGASSDANLTVERTSAADTRERVRRGRTSVAVVIPAGFGDRAATSLFRGEDKPQLDVLYDPSRAAEVAMVRGILTEHVMQAVTREVFTAESGRRFVDDALARLDTTTGMSDQERALLRNMLASVRAFYDSSSRPAGARSGGGLTMPYTVREEAVTSRSQLPYNAYAHAFAGMGIQFVLFAMANLGVGILLERQRGLWKRLRSAPVSRYVLLAAQATSGAIISFAMLLVCFGFAMIVFRVRIDGSLAGFLAVAGACSIMASTFGLLIAAIGRTPATAGAVTRFAVLLMMMVGGGWVPAFLFPSWLQTVSMAMPARWAVDGLDFTTWRGLGFSSAIVPSLVLLVFALLFAAVTVARFRWEES